MTKAGGSLPRRFSGDGLCGPTRGADWYDGGKWVNMHRHTWTSDDEGVNRMWYVIWQGITTCNQALDLMNQLPPSEAIDAKKKEVEVMRAFYYYLLIDNYGDAPYLTTAIDAPDLPFKIKREAIFDSIVTTITNALPSLKPIDKKYMMTRYAAFALLAKLYLNAEVYTRYSTMGKSEPVHRQRSCRSLFTGIRFPGTLQDQQRKFKGDHFLHPLR